MIKPIMENYLDLLTPKNYFRLLTVLRCFYERDKECACVQKRNHTVFLCCVESKMVHSILLLPLSHIKIIHLCTEKKFPCLCHNTNCFENTYIECFSLSPRMKRMYFVGETPTKQKMPTAHYLKAETGLVLIDREDRKDIGGSCVRKN